MFKIKFKDPECAELIYDFMLDSDDKIIMDFKERNYGSCNYSIMEYIYYNCKKEFKQYAKEKGIEVIYD